MLWFRILAFNREVGVVVFMQTNVSKISDETFR